MGLLSKLGCKLRDSAGQDGCKVSTIVSNSNASHISNVFNYSSFNIVILQQKRDSADHDVVYQENPTVNANLVDISVGSIGKGDLGAEENRAAKIWALNALTFSSSTRTLCRPRHEKSDTCCDALNMSIRQRFPIDYLTCFEPNVPLSSYTNTSSPLKDYWPTGSRFSVLASPQRKSLTTSCSLGDSSRLNSAFSSKVVVHPSLSEEG